MQIDIFSDLICPWCFIGKRRLEAALAARPDLDVVITWQPFELNPDMPDEGMDLATYMTRKFGSPDSAERLYAPIREAGRSLGLDFAFDRRTVVPNTARAHAVLSWAQLAGLGDAMVETLFSAYFRDGLDIGDPGMLARLAADAGLDPDYVEERLASGADITEVRDLAARAREMGLTGVPCFVIERKYVLVGAQEAGVFLDLFDRIESGEPIAVEEAAVE